MLKQKIIYLLYETHAATEHDKNKFASKTVLNLGKAIRQVSKDIPDIEK